MKSKLLMLFICQFFRSLIATPSVAQPIDITSGGWQFKTGDDKAWASPQWKDADWHNIAVGMTWEAALLKDGYDGFAWYRKTIIVPEHLKKTVKRGKSMILKLGMIDDADETFFNGVKIGAKGKFPPDYASAWDEPRQYLVPFELIRFGEPNVIAVRVYDQMGGGGLHSGEYILEPLSWKDKFKIIIDNAVSTHAFSTDKPVTLKVNFLNNSETKLSGTVQCEVKTFSGKSVATKNHEVAKILRGGTVSVPNFEFDIQDKGFYVANVQFKDTKGYTVKAKKGFAVAPEQVISEPTRPADFEEFWLKTRYELDSVAPDFKIDLNEKLTTDRVEVFDVEMKSLHSVRVRGYYTRPIGKQNVPAILHVQGYSSVMTPFSLDNTVAAFFLNIRGHGNSRDDVNPGFPGYLLSGIDKPETYIYRGAYMDCIRAIDFLCSRAEVDTARIAVEGGSQGGALSIAAAALDKRVKLCMADVPFLSDFKNYFDIASWPASEFKSHISKTGKKWEDLYAVLDYIDIKNMTPSITCPVIMGVGLYDDVCPPAINFAAYNNLKSEDKMYILYPHSGHSLPGPHYEVKMAWMKKKFDGQ
jgi:cephalosporin-C deacetylase-like acetyl esterase